jgi:hypothetical protein
MRAMRYSLALGALYLLSGLAPAVQDGDPAEAAEEEPPPVLERVFVAGASVSDGFGLSKDLKTKMTLAHVFDAACAAEDAHFVPLGDARFFLDPRSAGKRMIDTVIEGKATCFVGLDFLFWYAYGIKSEKLRVEYIDDALKELERLECPILLGDLPDMSIALKGSFFGRPMITPEMIPTEETLVEVNQHLNDWAEARANVHVAPLASLLRQIQSGEKILLRDVLYEPESLSELLQADLLHLTAEGSMALCLLVGDVLVRNFESIDVEDFVFDREKSMARLLEIAARKREAELKAREASREERRRKREERRRDDKEGQEAPQAPHGLRAAS